MQRISFGLTLVACLVFFSAPTFAATGRVTAQMKVTTADLDPGDAVDSAITIISAGTTITANNKSDRVAGVDAAVGPLNISGGGAEGISQSFGGSPLSEDGWSANVYAGSFAYGQPVNTRVGFRANYVLTAKSLLVISVSFPTIEAERTDVLDVAFAYAGLSFEEWGGSHSAFAKGSVGFYTPDATGPLQITFENSTDHSVQGSFALLLWAAAMQYTAPVPELSTSALMIFGMCGLGAVARRRAAL